MRDQNLVRVTGRVGMDATLKRTSSGREVMQVRLCTATEAAGLQWHAVVCWSPELIALAPRITKGARIAVDGVLRTGCYVKGDEKRYRTEVWATRIDLIGHELDDHDLWLRAEAEWDEEDYFSRMKGLDDAPF